jgi:twitching motility protein PilT
MNETPLIDPDTITLPMLLKTMLERGASDMHLTIDSPPQLRIDGSLVPVRTEPLNAKQTQDLCYAVLNETQRKKLHEERELDLAFGVENMARFRVNFFHQRGCLAAAFRQIPWVLKSAEDLGLPAHIVELTKLRDGLILVTGPTGSGKSTTLAALIDRINTSFSGHIVTIEDPVEYVHTHKACIVSQREVGSDTHGFSTALKYALRQDPDVVLIGEMRDLETIEAALTLAETGHLTFATLHTNSASSTISRIVDAFPSDSQSRVGVQLSNVLRAVVSQQLLPKVGGGRALALEYMRVNSAIANLIRKNDVNGMYSQIQMGRGKYSMQTMNDALLRLVKSRWVNVEDAVAKSPNPDELRQSLG